MSGCARVYLVGAGSGDPDLLTVKALRLLQEVDVVVYDRLVSDEVLARIPAGVTRIFAGKAAGNHPIPQEEINEMLVRLARGGHRVVRLKGGDPFMFARGGEEALYLAEHQVDFEVVPGITAACACAAYAGIPLTHRDMAKGVKFLTGHCHADWNSELNWESFSDPSFTLVIYMGLAKLGLIQTRLLEVGRDPHTPAALIERGTTAAHRQVLTTLGALQSAAIANGVKPPTLIIVGEVVSLSRRLTWFDASGERAKQAPVTVTHHG